jgi:hypothetical protein
VSAAHHYCRQCDRSFATAARLKVHIETALVHTDTSDDDTLHDNDEGYRGLYLDMPGWEDIEGALQYLEESEVREQLVASGEAVGLEQRWDDEDNFPTHHFDVEGAIEVGDLGPIDISDDESEEHGSETDESESEETLNGSDSDESEDSDSDFDDSEDSNSNASDSAISLVRFIPPTVSHYYADSNLE